jgi:plasmid stabilization system protein ParE
MAWEKTINDALTRLAQAIQVADELAVETRYVPTGAGEAGTDPGQARPVARTIIRWDRASAGITPVEPRPPGHGAERAPAGPEVVSETLYEADALLYAVHRDNVVAARAYWARLLNAVPVAMPFNETAL